MKTEFRFRETTVKIVRGDILELDVDAVVNPANINLQHGGGLAGQIVRKGGNIIQEESDRLAPINTGDAIITSAGKLKARYIIHTAGPVQGEGDEDKKITKSFLSVLSLAVRKGLTSIAIPAVSTGIFGYPTERCAARMKQVFIEFLKDNPGSLKTVTVCLFEQQKYEIFLKEFNA